MGEPKLTEAQKRALREIEARHVTWSRFSLAYWNHHTQRYMRTPTMSALSNRGLSVLVHDPVGADMPVLTDRGREVLADA